MTHISTRDYGVVNSMAHSHDELLDPKNYAMASALLSMRKRRRLAYMERDLEIADRKKKEVETWKTQSLKLDTVSTTTQ